MNPKTVKIFLWHVLVLVFALLMWGSGSHAEFNAVTGIAIRLPSLGAFLMLTSIIAIGFMLFREKRWIWPLSTSLIVGLLFLFQFGFTGLNLAAVAIVVGLFYEAYNRIDRELKDRIRINSSLLLRHGLYPIIVAIFIMISFAAYQSPWADQIAQSNRLPSQTQSFFRQIVDNTIGPKIDNSNPKERDKILNEVSTQTYNDINSFLKPYFRYAPPIVAFGLFLILWGLSPLFVVVASLVGMFWFWLLKKTKVVSVQEQDVKAQVLVV